MSVKNAKKKPKFEEKRERMSTEINTDIQKSDEPAHDRYDYIDCAKLLGIALMLFDHSVFGANLQGPVTMVKVWICSFHMPFFFLVYGMVASHKKIHGFRAWLKFLERKFIALLIPYILWVFICSTGFGSNFFAGMLYGTNPSLGHAETNSTLWFLPVMFSAAVLYQIFINIESKFNAAMLKFIVPIELLVSMFLSLCLKKNQMPYSIPFGIDIAFTACAFILIGYYLIMPLMKKLLSLESYIYILAAACLCIGIGYFISLKNPPPGYNETVVALALYGKSYPLFVITACINTFGILCVSKLISNKYLSWMGKFTIVIMSAHHLSLPYTTAWSRKIVAAVSNQSVYGFAYTITNIVLTLIIFIPVIAFIKKYIPPLAGKSK